MNKKIVITISSLSLLVTIYYLLTTDIFINNSFGNLLQVLDYMLHPTISIEIFKNIITGFITTITISVCGLSIGLFVGIILNYHGTKFRKIKIGKYISILFRSVHELVLIYILLLIFGLNIYTALFAIGISYGGSLSKVFTDNMNLTSTNTHNLYKNRQYNYQNFYTYYLHPTYFKNNLVYLFYRLECAIRSSIVLGYVGIGGIGFYLTIAYNDANYYDLFTYLYSIIIFVLLFNFTINKLININKIRIEKLSIILLLIPTIVLLLFTITHLVSLNNLFIKENIFGINKSIIAIKNLLLFDNEFYTYSNLSVYAKYTFQTIILGVIATTFMLLLFFISLIHFTSSLVSKSKVSLLLNNVISIIFRSIPEIVFLTFILFIMKPTIISGALALALHNFGIMLKLIKERFYNEQFQIFEVYRKRNLSAFTLFIFIVLPLLFKDIINLTMYRFEMIIKSSVIVGILGSGGLGYLFKLSVAKNDYQSVYFIALIYCIILLFLEFINKQIHKKQAD